jgi:hypothetical protein
MNITTEFPAFDNVDAFTTILEAFAPLGFVDTSWSNDVCPSIGLFTEDGDETIYRIWIDYRDPSKREFEGLTTFTMTSEENTIVASDDLERFICDVKIQLIADFAETYIAELVQNLTPPERDAVRENRAVPCDFYDSNESKIIAWQDAFGRSPFDTEGHLSEAVLQIINAALPIAHLDV